MTSWTSESESPYRIGQAHAREFLTAAGSLESDLGRMYLDREKVWPDAGPFTWESYIRGAKSVLGDDRVVGGPRPTVKPGP